MIQRCTNPNTWNYDKYGGRGITVDPRWLQSFPDFLADMGLRPEGTTLDRWPDPDGNYTKDNCCWSTPAEQNMHIRPMLPKDGAVSCAVCGDWTTSKYGICDRTPECKKAAKHAGYLASHPDSRSKVKLPCKVCGKWTTNVTGVCVRTPECEKVSRREQYLIYNPAAGRYKVSGV